MPSGADAARRGWVSRAARSLRRLPAAAVAVAAVVGLIAVLDAVHGHRVPAPVVAAAGRAAARTGPPADLEPTRRPPVVYHPPEDGRTEAPPRPAAARPPLTVLNNSRITGLARRAAVQFARGGWRVAAVGNLAGRVAVTTVYYGPGQQASARALAAQFRIVRVRPRFTGLPGSGLTVVVTSGFPA